VTDSSTAVAQFTATTNAAVGQAQQVAQQAVAQIDAGTFGCEAWCQSMLTLFNIVARGSATHFQTAISQQWCGSCEASPMGQTSGCGLQPSDAIFVDPDNNFSRQLSVAVPFRQVGGQMTIPTTLIGFVAAHETDPGVLPPGATSFKVYLRDPKYIGLSYTGTVRLTRITSNVASALSVDKVVTVEL
jgi:hypothetical protein